MHEHRLDLRITQDFIPPMNGTILIHDEPEVNTHQWIDKGQSKHKFLRAALGQWLVAEWEQMDTGDATSSSGVSLPGEASEALAIAEDPFNVTTHPGVHPSLQSGGLIFETYTNKFLDFVGQHSDAVEITEIEDTTLVQLPAVPGPDAGLVALTVTRYPNAEPRIWWGGVHYDGAPVENSGFALTPVGSGHAVLYNVNAGMDVEIGTPGYVEQLHLAQKLLDKYFGDIEALPTAPTVIPQLVEPSGSGRNRRRSFLQKLFPDRPRFHSS